jgi:hypothetical protein
MNFVQRTKNRLIHRRLWPISCPYAASQQDRFGNHFDGSVASFGDCSPGESMYGE